MVVVAMIQSPYGVSPIKTISDRIKPSNANANACNNHNFLTIHLASIPPSSKRAPLERMRPSAEVERNSAWLIDLVAITVGFDYLLPIEKRHLTRDYYYYPLIYSPIHRFRMLSLQLHDP